MRRYSIIFFLMALVSCEINDLQVIDLEGGAGGSTNLDVTGHNVTKMIQLSNGTIVLTDEQQKILVKKVVGDVEVHDDFLSDGSVILDIMPVGTEILMYVNGKSAAYAYLYNQNGEYQESLVQNIGAYTTGFGRVTSLSIAINSGIEQYTKANGTKKASIVDPDGWIVQVEDTYHLHTPDFTYVQAIGYDADLGEQYFVLYKLNSQLQVVGKMTSETRFTIIGANAEIFYLVHQGKVLKYSASGNFLDELTLDKSIAIGSTVLSDGNFAKVESGVLRVYSAATGDVLWIYNERRVFDFVESSSGSFILLARTNPNTDNVITVKPPF